MKLYLAYTIIALAAIGIITIGVVNPNFRWALILVASVLGAGACVVWAIATICKQFNIGTL